MERRRHRAGQALVEYMIISAILLMMMTIMAVFLFAFREHAGRVLDLIAYGYP